MQTQGKEWGNSQGIRIPKEKFQKQQCFLVYLTKGLDKEESLFPILFLATPSFSTDKTFTSIHIFIPASALTFTFFL